jgi:hypothetical protein
MPLMIDINSHSGKKSSTQPGYELRVSKVKIRSANVLINKILLCLSGHINEVNVHPIDITVQSIVQEIYQYKETNK